MTHIGSEIDKTDVQLSGKEGKIDIIWVRTYGGACPPAYAKIQLKNETLPVCHEVNSNIEYWSQITKQFSLSGDPALGVEINAQTTAPYTLNRNILLRMFSTLQFSEVPIATITAPVTTTMSIETSNWLLYTNTNDNFTIKYPGNFTVRDIATYEGGGTEKYIADSQASINKWQTNNENLLTNQNIVVEPLYLSFPYSDAGNHTLDEKLQKIVNLDLGTVGCKTATWVNQNGNSCQTAPAFIRLTIDNKPAARVPTQDGVVYIILNGDNYLKLLSMPNNSIFIPVFDKMVSTLRFTQGQVK